MSAGAHAPDSIPLPICSLHAVVGATMDLDAMWAANRPHETWSVGVAIVHADDRKCHNVVILEALLCEMLRVVHRQASNVEREWSKRREWRYCRLAPSTAQDRKSTRLNSSH